jgi:hypothetical protein
VGRVGVEQRSGAELLSEAPQLGWCDRLARQIDECDPNAPVAEEAQCLLCGARIAPPENLRL